MKQEAGTRENVPALRFPARNAGARSDDGFMQCFQLPVWPEVQPNWLVRAVACMCVGPGLA